MANLYPCGKSEQKYIRPAALSPSTWLQEDGPGHPASLKNNLVTIQSGQLILHLNSFPIIYNPFSNAFPSYPDLPIVPLAEGHQLFPQLLGQGTEDGQGRLHKSGKGESMVNRPNICNSLVFLGEFTTHIFILQPG